MVVQICCSVDFAYFLKRLREDYPNEQILGYFYNPNIHPYAEFMLRYHDCQRVAKKHGIELILGEYDLDGWFEYVKGQEKEPERGERCLSCFDYRLSSTVKFAKSKNEKKITTTLLMSPKKSHDQLKKSLAKICQKENLEFIAPDYRKEGGSQAQMSLAKKENLYHQNFCGCMYALKDMSKFSLEAGLMSPVNGQILPGSIEERIKFYSEVIKSENPQIRKDKFINYRLLFARVKFNDKVIKSYFLYGSHFERNLVKFSIAQSCEEFYSDKECIRMISLAKFCEISGVKFSSMSEFLSTPLSIDDELKFRDKILKADSFSPIIIVENLYEDRVKIEVTSKLYLDVREILA
ncbi:MAG: epoxyqueuosine reductase QueH [Campylobacter sp.]|nr:epoxyqueuosine reductase QueH [Campylobacter sp.]